MPDPASVFAARGWVRLPSHPATLAWARHALGDARRAVAASENARWLRCEGTWFAGVNILQNDAAGRLPGGPPLEGPAMSVVRDLGLGDLALDPAQVSVIYPGYPRPMDGESQAASRYRRERDGAHVDGLLKVGPEGRRYPRETHGYILGLPLTETGEGASPLVVWEGSHEIIRAAFEDVLAPRDPAVWRDIDLTDAYHAARRQCFEDCPRVTVAAKPGEAVLVHRLALHGIAPWEEGADASEDGRMIAYFRPEIDARRWLS